MAHTPRWKDQQTIKKLMTETISITRALVELKTLEKRISKKITSLEPVTVIEGEKLPAGISSLESFTKEAKAIYHSITDLQYRRAVIKSSVVQSNAATEVTIAGETMTVAEAIERKSSIENDKLLRRRIESQYAAAIEKMEKTNSQLKAQLLKLLEATYSKPEAQLSKEDHEKVSVPFMKSNEARLIDPLDAKNLSQKIEEQIVLFESEVDVVLSESNARTTITV